MAMFELSTTTTLTPSKTTTYVSSSRGSVNAGCNESSDAGQTEKVPVDQRSEESMFVGKVRANSDCTEISNSDEDLNDVSRNGSSALNYLYHHHQYELPNQQERDIVIREVKPFSNTNTNTKCRVYSKICLGTLIVITLVTFIVIDSSYLESTIEAFFTWVGRHPGVGIVAFIGVCYFCTLLFLPVSIVSSGGGFVFANSFGIWIGASLATAAVFVGACLGAITAFLGGRYLMRETAQSLKEKYPLLEAIDSVLTEKGVRIIILLHLCPLIPFNVLNWIGGTSSMPIWTYAWTLIAILPGTLVYVCLGATASSLTLHQGKSSVWEIVSVVVGLILGTIGIFTMSYYAKQELRKITVQRQAAAALENELI